MIAIYTCIYAYLFYQYWWAYSADRKLFGNWGKVVFKEINVFLKLIIRMKTTMLISCYLNVIYYIKLLFK